MSCDCCGIGIESEDDIGQRIDADQVWCKGCGGDPEAKSIKARMGWALSTFFDARIPILAERLNPENRRRFGALSYAAKCRMIERLIEKGAMI